MKKAVLKSVFPILDYYEIESCINTPVGISCFKPGNPDYDSIWKNPGPGSQAPQFETFYKNVNSQLNQYLANGDISSEILPQDRFELDKENHKCILYIRWENKAALEEYVAWRWGKDIDPVTCNFDITTEIIDLPD